MVRYQKSLNRIIWVTVAVLGCCFLLRGGKLAGTSHLSDDLFKVIGKIENVLDQNAIETYLPGLMYPVAASGKERSLGEYITELALALIPISGYVEENAGYETQIENTSTYEMIVASEANDENQVDEMTGELILPEQDVALMEQENAKAKQNDAQAKDVQQAPAAEAAAVQGPQISQSSPMYNMDKLGDFDYLLKNLYVVDKTTTITSRELNASQLLEKDMKVNKDNTVPQILIYHTHSQEGFTDSVPGDTNTTIVGVGAYLTSLLRDTYGYNVMHHTAVYDMVGGKLDRNQAYTLAGAEVEEILKENPSIEVVIDLHRDGVNENTHLVTDINGKPTANFMFFNGMSRTTKNGDISYLANPYISDNLAFSFQLQLKADQYYPSLARKIYLKGYRYNLHLKPKALIVEVGAQTNTIEEEKNAMEPLADIINKVLLGE